MVFFNDQLAILIYAGSLTTSMPIVLEDLLLGFPKGVDQPCPSQPVSRRLFAWLFGSDGSTTTSGVAASPPATTSTAAIPDSIDASTASASTYFYTNSCALLLEALKCLFSVSCMLVLFLFWGGCCICMSADHLSVSLSELERDRLQERDIP